MDGNKTIYINENYNSDDEDQLIYGGNQNNNEIEVPSPVKEITEEEVPSPTPSPIQEEVAEEEVSEEVPSSIEEVSEEVPSPIKESSEEAPSPTEEFTTNNETPNEEEVIVISDSDSDDEEISNNEDPLLLNHSLINGGSPKKLDEDEDETGSISSLDTDAILNVDPLYFRLTKFLQTGGEEPENVAEILKKINMNLDKMNTNIENFLNKVN